MHLFIILLLSATAQAMDHSGKISKASRREISSKRYSDTSQCTITILTLDILELAKRAVELEEQAKYHEHINRKTTERVLQLQKDGFHMPSLQRPPITPQSYAQSPEDVANIPAEIADDPEAMKQLQDRLPKLSGERRANRRSHRLPAIPPIRAKFVHSPMPSSYQANDDRTAFFPAGESDSLDNGVYTAEQNAAPWSTSSLQQSPLCPNPMYNTPQPWSQYPNLITGAPQPFPRYPNAMYSPAQSSPSQSSPWNPISIYNHPQPPSQDPDMMLNQYLASLRQLNAPQGHLCSNCGARCTSKD